MRLRVPLLSLALVAATAVLTPTSGLPVASAASYVPTPGPVFANPGGDEIRNLLLKDINNAYSTSTIKAATAITDEGIANALINASQRGVDVKLVLPTHKTRGCGSATSDMLVHALGNDQSAHSWVTCIQGSARNVPGTPGHMHMKVWSFSQTGGKQDVMVVTSMNSTDSGRSTQYNDAYQSVGWTELSDAWADLFVELKADDGGYFWRRTWGASAAYATPVRLANDPIYERIQAIPANGATIRVAVSAISLESDPDLRPMRLAGLLIAKKNNGANISIVYTKTDGRTPAAVTRMANNGIRVRSFESDSSNSNDIYLHDKFMTATFLNSAGDRVHRVWLGSEEWKQSSLEQDEFVLQLGSPATYADYYARWTRLASLSSDH